MSCFPCFRKKQDSNENVRKGGRKGDDLPIVNPVQFTPPPHPLNGDDNNKEDQWLVTDEEYNSTKNFTFRELASATKNFRQEYLLGEGAYGKIYKGLLKGSEPVVIRHLDRDGGAQGAPEFVMEVAKLNLLEHRNLVKLVGYCAEGDQRLLVYEYMPRGSLMDNLFELSAGKKPLSWSARIKIASGIAAGLEYLHEKTYPAVVYGELKSSNILLDEENTAHISKHGLLNLVHKGNEMIIVSPAVVIDSGYNAPEYEKTRVFTTKTDVYSFGVVLLELISGRKAFDPTQPMEEQHLVDWARPIFKDQARFHNLADPALKNGFLDASLYQAVGIAAMCLQEEPLARPLMSDVATALSFIAMALPKDKEDEAQPPPQQHNFTTPERHPDDCDYSSYTEEEFEAMLSALEQCCNKESSCTEKVNEVLSANDGCGDNESSDTEEERELTSPSDHCNDIASSDTKEEHEFTSFCVDHRVDDDTKSSNIEVEHELATIPNGHCRESKSSGKGNEHEVTSSNDRREKISESSDSDSDSSSDDEYGYYAKSFNYSDFDSDMNSYKKMTAETNNIVPKELMWNSRRRSINSVLAVKKSVD